MGVKKKTKNKKNRKRKLREKKKAVKISDSLKKHFKAFTRPIHKAYKEHCRFSDTTARNVNQQHK